jgi:UDP-N-acetylglucosamine--N-acetylmuramyl-(pentapeptide) pyrophosphoryl-undecaprenol N-acetylglucosamine transferase
MTMSEIQATATPAVVVPLPAGRGYQAGNAEDVVGSGGAILVPQGDVEEVASAVRALVDDPERLRAMRASVPSVDHRRAASIIADRIMEVTDA